MQTFHRIIHQRQIQIFLLLMFISSCRKPDAVLPEGPQSIVVKAIVPARIYSNIKKVLLDASVTPSLNGLRPLIFSWSCTDFPAVGNSPLINTSDQTIASVENLAIGKYKFQLTVKDNLGNINVSSYQLEVMEDSIIGKIPIAKAGSDHQISAPMHDIILDGSETVPNNTPGRNLFYKWDVVQQPTGSSPVKILKGENIIATVQLLEEGLYRFQLEIKNEYGNKAFDTMEVRVLPDPLKGSSRIFENVKWQLGRYSIEDDWSNYYNVVYYIFLVIIEPDLFLYRYDGNMEVLVWDAEKKDWIDKSKYNWRASPSGELFITLSETDDRQAYLKLEGVITKVKVTFK